MSIKHRLERLENASDSRERGIIVGYSDEELERKVAEFKKENPDEPEPIRMKIIYDNPLKDKKGVTVEELK